MDDEFDILMVRDPLQLTAPPKDFGEVATFAIHHMKDAIVEERLHHLALLTFHGAEVRSWVLKGKAEVPIDDVIRGLSAQFRCDALVFVFPMPVPHEVVADRVVNVAVEGHGMSVDILFAMVGRWGDPAAKVQIHQRKHGATMRWLGAPSTFEFQFFRKDPVFGGPTEGEA